MSRFAGRCATVLGLVLACGNAADAGSYNSPARFKITDVVINKDVGAFAATMPGIGNNLIDEGSGFEPIIYRNKYRALENSADRVVVSPGALAFADTLREGFLDGADVAVYRIASGKFALVREDKVAVGGFHVSGWWRVLADDKIVPSTATRYAFRWDPWNQLGAKYYFTVRAIDRSGNLSPPSPTLAVDRPEKISKDAPPATPVTEFKPVRLTLDRSAPAAPANLRGTVAPDGTLNMEWDAVTASDLAGYVVFRSDYPPERHQGYYLQLSRAPAAAVEQIKTGDMIVVSKKFYSTSRTRQLSNRVWNAWQEYHILQPGMVGFFSDEHSDKSWELVRHQSRSPVQDPGETYLKLDLTGGVTESIGIWNHSGIDQDFYEVLEKKSYTVEVWLRRESGTGTVRFKFRGPYDQMIKPTVFTLGPEWKKYVTTFTPPEVLGGAVPAFMELEFTGPGTFNVDNFRVYRSDTAYLDLFAQEYQQLKASGIRALRTQRFVNTRFRTYDMAQITNSAGLTSMRPEARANTLPQVLRIMRNAGVRPWLQLEFHMNRREWLAFVEYMAAPYDPKSDTPATKPWAYKRFAQGQRKPWVDEFDRIYFELGNETWNGLFYPWNFDGMRDAASGKDYSPAQVYGLFQEYVIGTMRSSPYWSPASLDRKFEFVLGGWSGLDYGRDAAAMSPSSRYMAIAAYNGGWDEGEGPPRANAVGAFNVLAQAYQAAIPVADVQAKQAAELSSRNRSSVRPATYEAGPGYVLDGLNGDRVTPEQAREQEEVMKSLAAGTATLDTFLARAERGFELQNFFMMKPGLYWSSHARWFRGGQAYPSWKLITLFNNEGTGDMLGVETLSVPGIDLPAHHRRTAVKDGPLTAVYATRRAGRMNVFVISRKLSNYPTAGDDGYTPVTIDLPFNAAKSITLYRMTGDPMANNLTGDNVKIEKVHVDAALTDGKLTLNARAGADDRGLAPASTFLYVFDGITDARSGKRAAAAR